MARNDYIGELVGASLGHVEEVDIEYEEVEWGEFMQVRAILDIYKPLVRHKKLNISTTEPI